VLKRCTSLTQAKTGESQEGPVGPPLLKPGSRSRRVYPTILGHKRGARKKRKYRGGVLERETKTVGERKIRTNEDREEAKVESRAMRNFN